MQIIANKEDWNRLLEENFSEFNDVYFRYEYLELWAKHYGGEPEAIFWEDKNIKVFWTHLVRDTSKIDLTHDFNTERHDTTTPYGYGGPIFSPKTEDTEKVRKSLNRFFGDYEAYALENNYKSEFIRFHPLCEMWKYFSDNNLFRIQRVNDVVIIDLTQDLSTIFRNIKKGHRYNLKKTIEKDYKIIFESNPQKAHIDNFIKLYYQAMDRNKAAPMYYFTPEFISDHFKLLNALLVEVKDNGTVISSSVFLLGAEIIHYHLFGSDYDFRNFYPSDLTLWEAVKWAKANNFKTLHLGGGRGKNDSLFKFKSGFSDTTLPFYIGKHKFSMSNERKKAGE